MKGGHMVKSKKSPKSLHPTICIAGRNMGCFGFKHLNGNPDKV